MPDHAEHHDHAHVHSAGDPSDPQTTYVWRVHHPYEGVADRAAVEVGPRRGLLPRWRFVVPGDYGSVVKWGIGPPGGQRMSTEVRRPAEGGPVELINGPTVVWFGGHEALSSQLSAYLVFQGEPPHYLAFGQAEESGGPPSRLEGISFAQHHPAHPPVGHQHEHGEGHF